jgi:hypothetical protein
MKPRSPIKTMGYVTADGNTIAHSIEKEMEGR